MDKKFTHLSKYRSSLFIRKIVNRLNHFWAKQNLNRGLPQLVVFAYDHIGMEVNNFGRYEEDILDGVMSFLEKKFHIKTFDCVIDVGANIGNHSLFFSNKAQEVLSYEPNPKTFELLKINAGLSNNISIFNYGLSDQTSQKILIENNFNIGNSFIESTEDSIKNDGYPRYKIDLSTLDSIDELLEKNIDLIKIDVEGYELEVMLGGMNLINNNKPTILFELNKETIVRKNQNIQKFLKKHGYQLYSVSEYIYPKWKMLDFLFGTLFGRRITISKLEDLTKNNNQNFPLIIAIYDQKH